MLVLFSVCQQEVIQLEQTIEIETAYKVMFKDYPDVLKAEEVGKMLGIGRKQVYKLIQNGRLQKIPCAALQYRCQQQTLPAFNDKEDIK